MNVSDAEPATGTSQREWVVTLPDPVFAQDPGDLPPGVRVRLWDMTSPPADPAEIDVVVPPYMGQEEGRAKLAGLPKTAREPAAATRVMPTTAASWSSMLIHSWSLVNLVVMGGGS